MKKYVIKNIDNGITITPLEGYEIDKENSTFDKIIFKRIDTWRHSNLPITGFYVTTFGDIEEVKETDNVVFDKDGYNVCATEKQAKAIFAFSQITQIIANDPRFGGAITDEEWRDIGTQKYAIYKHVFSNILICTSTNSYKFLAFHTEEQCKLFLKENEDLVRQYYMLD